MEILIALASRPGELVDKSVLFEAAWPHLTVEESNLRVHIAALQKRLAEGAGTPRAIENVSGRGYRLTIPLKDDAVAPEFQPVDRLRSVQSPHIVGRSPILRELAALLPLRRFITVTGAGGIGKTTVAVAVAERLRGSYPDGVIFVDFGLLGDPSLVPEHLASAMRIPTTEAKVLDGIGAHVANRRILLVFDNCEHVIEAVTPLAEAIGASAPSTHILATSREPMRALGEWVFPLGALQTPMDPMSVTAEEARTYSAVELFIERATACLGQFELNAGNVAVVSQICARLDGLPLAIELAAVRLATLGLEELAERLDNRFDLLTKGRRSADPRHQTLAAMIDWSHETLSDDGKRVWRRLSVFAGAFSLNAALSVAEDPEDPEAYVVDLIDDLVSKSLIAVEGQKSDKRFRLLESMRIYGADKLSQSEEAQCVRDRHARRCLDGLRDTRKDWDAPLSDLRERAHEIADLRSALDWAYGPKGDVRLGIELTVESAPIWFELLLMPELRRYLERAREAFRRVGIDDNLLIAKLLLALAHAIFHTRGPRERVESTLSDGRGVAQAGKLTDLELQFIWSLFGHAVASGDYEGVARYAAEYARVGKLSDDPLVDATVDRLACLDNHLHGRHREAIACGERALSNPAALRPHRGHIFQYDHHVASAAHLARALWVSGRVDEASELCLKLTEWAKAAHQPFALGYALICGACPVAFWKGDMAAAKEYVGLLTDISDGAGLNVWEGDIFARALSAIEAEAAPHPVGLFSEASLTDYYADTLSTIEPRFLHGRSRQRALGGDDKWCTPEILRAEGERLLATDAEENVTLAESLFRCGLQMASRHGAMSWELRCATSLARSQLTNGHPADGLELLAQVYIRFDQGLQTRDLIYARDLL